MLRIIGIGEELLFFKDLSLPIHPTHVVMDSPWTHTRHDNSFQLWCHCQIISQLSIADTAGVFKLQVAHFDLQIFTLPRSDPPRTNTNVPTTIQDILTYYPISQSSHPGHKGPPTESRRRNAKLTSKLQLLMIRNI